MEYCVECGTSIEPDSDFCGQCGATVQRSATGDALLMSVEGQKSRIDLNRNKLTIHHRRRVVRGVKDIYLSRISSVQFKTPGMFTVGYIRFAFTGGQEHKGGVYNALNDENAVTFLKKQHQQFIDLKEYVEELLGSAEMSEPSPQMNVPLQQPSSGAQVGTDGFEQLEKLAELRDRGIITADDFEAKKRQILGL